MPNVVAGQLFQTVWSFNNDQPGTGVYINKCYYRVRAIVGGGTRTEQDLADGMSQSMGDTWRPISSNQYGYFKCEVQTWPGGVRSAGSASILGAGVGAVGATGVPPTTAWVIRKRTPFAGRKYRGRAFIVGLPATFVSGGAINDTGVLALDDSGMVPLICGLFTVATPGGDVTVDAVIVHTVGTAEPTVNAQVTNGVYDRVLRSQRRRQNGVGS